VLARQFEVVVTDSYLLTRDTQSAVKGVMLAMGYAEPAAAGPTADAAKPGADVVPKGKKAKALAKAAEKPVAKDPPVTPPGEAAAARAAAAAEAAQRKKDLAAEGAALKGKNAAAAAALLAEPPTPARTTGAAPPPKAVTFVAPSGGSSRNMCAAGAKEAPLRAADVAVFEDPSAELTAFLQAVRVCEHLVNTTSSLTVEPCCRRAMRQSHDNCRPAAGKRECTNCARGPHDDALDAIQAKVLVQCSAELRAELSAS